MFFYGYFHFFGIHFVPMEMNLSAPQIMLHFIHSFINPKSGPLKRRGLKKIETVKKPKRVEGAKRSTMEPTKYGSLIMEKKDFVMILRQWNVDNALEDYSHKDTLDILEGNMADAIVLHLSDMPKDVIRLYSWATVSSGSGWCETFQLMLPLEEDIERGMISVHSSLGATVIGHAEGDLLNFCTPIGIIPLKIESVEQSGGYVKTDVSDEDYENLFSERQKAFLSGSNMELRQN